MVTVVIQQPTYLPWLGYFELIAKSDIFVFLDSVQFERHSWQNRNRLRTVAGEPFWLTLPVERTHLNTPINQIKILRSNTTWIRKHENSIQASLGRASFFETYRGMVEAWINHDVLMLADLNVALITDVARLLGFAPTFVRAMDLPVSGAKTSLVLDICRHLGATHYYSARGSKTYLQEEPFKQHGISLSFQDWEHPEYQQAGKGFVSHLAVIDTLMNIGAERTRALILGEKAD